MGFSCDDFYTNEKSDDWVVPKNMDCHSSKSIKFDVFKCSQHQRQRFQATTFQLEHDFILDQFCTVFTWCWQIQLFEKHIIDITLHISYQYVSFSPPEAQHIWITSNVNSLITHVTFFISEFHPWKLHNMELATNIEFGTRKMVALKHEFPVQRLHFLWGFHMLLFRGNTHRLIHSTHPLFFTVGNSKIRRPPASSGKERRIFVGFKSRWRMPWRWRCWSPRRISWDFFSHQGQGPNKNQEGQ